jgi:glycosyltransferase involved in cell wall biosynthesis
MRIAEIVTGEDISGAARVALMVSRALVARGHDVVFLHRPGAEIAAEAGALGLPLVESDFRHGRATYETVMRTLAAAQIDVLHTHMTGASNLGAALRLLYGVPTVASIHSRKAQPHWLLNNRAIVLSEGTAARIARIPWIGRKRVIAITNFVPVGPAPSPTAKLRLRVRLGIAPDAFVVGSLGRVTEVKGVGVLIRAMGLVQRAGIAGELVLIGSAAPAEREHFLQAARAFGLGERLRFLGMRLDAAEILSALDVYASASRDEQMPLSVLEAMAAGLPIVATDVGGMARLVAEGATGYLVPVDDAERLAERIIRLARDPAARRAFGAASFARLKAEFSADAVMPRVEQVLAEAAGEGRRWRARLAAGGFVENGRPAA